jgi:hypothetical protein
MKSAPQALARQAPTPIAMRDPESILRYAIDAKADVAVIERLMVVREKLQAESAKAAFDASMAAFQSECPIILKEKSGAKNAYKYAPLDAIVDQVRGLTQKHGFSFSVTSAVDTGWVKAICKITHALGHSEVSEFRVPVDDKNPMMTAPQRYGGAMTFAKRYAFCNGFGILTADEDLDGHAARPKPAGPKQATEKTRTWMLEQLKPLHVRMQAFGIDKGFIMPNEGLESWPLESVPTSAQALAELRKQIESHA